MSAPKSPVLAGALSLLLPGLGQLANRELAKGLSVLSVAVGILGGAALSLAGPELLRSRASAILLILLYPFLWIPAVTDAYRTAAGRPSPALSGERVWYVLLMLATVGPMAMPLLWQSPRFTRPLKVALTVTVILVAFLAVALVLYVGPHIEPLLDELLG